ncbi:TIGR01621 family pseudouridine synthase [Thiomicrospira sp. R3]|uniref:TIGR01621 family pseudouridine synthase n=1 Tax=Thiomicrospira sp. R3 TaxID=3035472 RepID=UPI00259BB9D9|nr:TIGR01621 family pseudouridine synthase [Thiomicrospira sp. R3]WFE68492.1 TIGR01621 family pseudouridine synthase [Thiomicrospira sp. R3]
MLDSKLNVIFENATFVLINKPAGLSFHSEQTPGLVVLAQKQLELKEIYPVHRLDKMTSGLVLLAKTLAAAQAFQTMFEQRQIEKFYLVISTHKPKKKQGWIKGDMQPSRRGSWRLTTSMENPAITQFINASLAPNERAFLVKPHTGKTHQIRVALKSLGAPIAGDRRYQAVQQAEQEDRGYLHAYALRFELFGEHYAFVCPPSDGKRFVNDNFRLQCAAWSQPWTLF